MSSKPFSEVPYQNFSLIKRNVQGKFRQGLLSDENLFLDPSFPPDLTSLSYVYTGDDRYEKMQFKRPLSLESNAIFCGVGGAWGAPFPWKSFKKRDWFQAAVLVVSLSVRYLEKIIPGYRNCEQNFIKDYIGAFRFNIWRFGEWQEIIVDDNLPCLHTTLLYCQAYGDPPEFWGALLEKAYAKIMKTYESIEQGHILNALSDLTGDICEFYTQDINPPANLFYIMYKSYLNRSLMVCWRNEKRLTHTGFLHTLESVEPNTAEEDESDRERFLHIITAITKFPITDGRWIEMVRLRCHYTAEPNWHGKFSDSDHSSWDSVLLWFLDKYKPLYGKESDEYWMTYEDFRCNFGGLIITSGLDPYRIEGLGIERYYKRADSFDYETRSSNLNTTNGEKIDGNSESKNHPSSLYVVRSSSSKSKNISNTSQIQQKPHSYASSKSNQDNFVNILLNSRNTMCNTNNNENRDSVDYKNWWTWRRGSEEPNFYPFSRIESIGSVKSHDSESLNGESELSVSFREVSYRRKSAPILGRNFSASSLSHLTHSSFLATKTDNFRSCGGWKMLVESRKTWSASPTLSTCPRVHFSISKQDVANEMIPPNCHGKSHVIISLLQDYRRGPTIKNSLLGAIGACLYKCKQSECKDLSKYKYIGKFETHEEERETTARFDLEEGNYVLLPYSKVCHREGEFLIRVLGEKESCGTRSGCIVS